MSEQVITREENEGLWLELEAAARRQAVSPELDIPPVFNYGGASWRRVEDGAGYKFVQVGVLTSFDQLYGASAIAPGRPPAPLGEEALSTRASKAKKD